MILIKNLFFVACVSTMALANTEWLADRPRDFKALLADPRETQVRAGFLKADNQKSYMELGLGGHLGIVREESEDSATTLMARALIGSRFEIGSRSFDLQNTDFIGGLAGSYRKNDDALELFLFHQSSHLGDGIPQRNYSLESLRVLYSRTFSLLRLYGGGEIKLRSDPRDLAGKFSLISGGDWHFTEDFFTAVDIRFKQETDFKSNVTFVIGYELGPLPRRHRIFLELFDGYSNLGQFAHTREFYAMLGFGFTL